MNKNLQQKLLNSGRSLHERRVIKKMIMEADDTGPKPTEDDPKKKLEGMKGSLKKYENTQHLPETLKNICGEMLKKIENSMNLESINSDKEWEVIDRMTQEIEKNEKSVRDFLTRSLGPGRGGVDHSDQVFKKLNTYLNSISSDNVKTMQKAIQNSDKKWLEETSQSIEEMLKLINNAKLGAGTDHTEESKDLRRAIFTPLKDALSSLMEKIDKSIELDPKKIFGEAEGLIKATKNMFAKLNEVIKNINADDKGTSLLDVLGRKNETPDPATGP